MDNDPVTGQALEVLLRSFMRSLSAADVAALLAGTLELNVVPAASGQISGDLAGLLAAAVDSGEAADLAVAIKAMRARGWSSLADGLAAAFARTIAGRGRSPSAPCLDCGHGSDVHSPDLGCWMCAGCGSATGMGAGQDQRLRV